MPFPFLKLPDIIQDNVLRLTEDFDRIIFSSISNRTKNIVKRASCTLRSMEWMLDDNRKNFLDFSESADSRFVFTNELPAEERENGQWTRLLINGNVYPALKTPTQIYMEDFARPFRHPWKIMEEMTKHVLEVSRCDQFDLVATTDSEDLFVFNYTHKFNLLQYEAETHGRKSSARLSDFLLRDVEVTNELYFFLFPEDGYTYSGPLRMSILSPYEDDFLTEEAILNMECRRAYLCGGWEDVHLNGFIKKWLSGGLQNIEKCMFSTNHVLNEDTLFEGIQTIPFSLDNRPSRRSRTENDSEGVDIRRSDGCLATINIVTGGVYESVLTIYVWKELM